MSRGICSDEHVPLAVGAARCDVEPTVSLIAQELRALGVRAWFDETQLTMGMGLRRSIDHGLAHSRFGVVVMSHSFFSREWPQRELDGLVALQVAGRQRVLPVWHGVTHDDVLGYSPTLADTIAGPHV